MPQVLAQKTDEFLTLKTESKESFLDYDSKINYLARTKN